MLWFPLLHELIHCLIAKLFNADIIRLEFTYMVLKAPADSMVFFVQDVFDVFTGVFPFVFFLFFLCLYFKENNICFRMRRTVEVT